jgi:glutamate formiminotransferase/formiminotetrahydrofolate cyclodeaminase
MQLRGYSPAMLLDRKVREIVSGGEAVDAFLSRVAGPTPTPGGGSVAAHAGALGAALAQMVAGLTIGKKKYAAVESEMKELSLRASALRRQLAELVQRDADSYETVRAAYAMPREPEDAAAARNAAIQQALIGASEVPKRPAPQPRATGGVAERGKAMRPPMPSRADCRSGVGGAALNVQTCVTRRHQRRRRR